MSIPHRRSCPGSVHLLLAILFASVLSGCLATGKAGVLAFDYHARDRLLGHDSPDSAAVAAGGEVELRVYSRMLPSAGPAGGGDGLQGVTRPRPSGAFGLVEVLRAQSSFPGVARVGPPLGTGVHVRGVLPGIADISVETERGGDTVTVAVAEVASVTIEHWLGLLLDERFAAEAAFVQGGTGRFLITLRDASGRRVVGAGIVPPIVVAPDSGAAVAAIAAADLHHAEIRFDRAGAVDLGMARRDPLRVAVIEPPSVTALAVVAVDLEKGEVRAPSGLPQGRGLGVVVRGELADGRKVLLLGDVATVTSATPEVCATPPAMTEQARLIFGDGIVAVDGTAPGKCTLVATLGALRAEAELTVEPAPSGSGQPAP